MDGWWCVFQSITFDLVLTKLEGSKCSHVCTHVFNPFSAVKFSQDAMRSSLQIKCLKLSIINWDLNTNAPFILWIIILLHLALRGGNMPFAIPARADAHWLRTMRIKNDPLWGKETSPLGLRMLIRKGRVSSLFLNPPRPSVSQSLTGQVTRARCQTGCTAHWQMLIVRTLFLLVLDYSVVVWVVCIVFWKSQERDEVCQKLSLNFTGGRNIERNLKISLCRLRWVDLNLCNKLVDVDVPGNFPAYYSNWPMSLF